MARKYIKLHLSVWDPASDFLELSVDAQWLYWVLCSHPLLSAAGIMPMQPRKWAKRAKGMTVKRVMTALDELAAADKVVIDDDTEELLVRTFIRWDNAFRTPNVKKAIEASITRSESCSIRHAAALELTHAERNGDAHE